MVIVLREKNRLVGKRLPLQESCVYVTKVQVVKYSAEQYKYQI